MAERRYTLSEITAAMGESLTAAKEVWSVYPDMRRFVDGTVDRLKAMPPVATESVLVIDIAMQGSAKGVQREAAVETTLTGVRWTLTGALAKAIGTVHGGYASPND